MKLNEDIKKELIVAIEATIKNGGTFPVEIQTSGKMNHKICIDTETSGYLIDTIQIEGKNYLIYLM